jgi:hypothetical protein
MNKPLVRIKNFSFSHADSSSGWNKPNYFQWQRDKLPADEYTFITDEYLKDYTNSNSIAFLVEPPSTNGPAYEFVYQNSQKFKYILTFCEDLIKVCKNALFYPYGSTFLKKEEFALYLKHKNTSMLLSSKEYTDGHKFRHICKNFILNKGVDIYQSSKDVHFNKVDTLKDYRYSIIVENGKYASYFSEKIIDCFVAGVIPIYHGCPTIDKFFNPDGIIKFNSPEELDIILKHGDNKLYELKMNAIKENFELAKKYLIAEDWIYKEYPFLFNI